jgi:hypothetical protein
VARPLESSAFLSSDDDTTNAADDDHKADEERNRPKSQYALGMMTMGLDFDFGAASDDLK